MSKSVGPLSDVFRAAMFVAFAQELRCMADDPDSAFSDSIRKAIDHHGVKPGLIVTKFAVTAATVSRWKNGEALPGGYMRREVLHWLADVVEREIPAAGRLVEEIYPRFLEIVRPY